MKTRSLTITFALAAAIMATAAVASFDTAVPTPGTNSDRISRVAARTDSLAPGGRGVQSQPQPSKACEAAVWPYIPAHCMKNADPERLRKPVRIIRIDASTPIAIAPVRR